MSRLKLLAFYFCLSILGTTATSSDENFEDADTANEFITMSFSSSQPYDLRHTIPGEPDIDYPIYSAIPKTSFDCSGRREGYYADMETRCQVFRICTNTDIVGRGFAFLCPNGTLFSQKDFVCDWYRNVDCNESEQYYDKNDGNSIGTRSQIMETVRQMMDHPMKTIGIALNRAQTVTQRPATRQSFKSTSGLRDSTFFRTTSTPIRNFSTHQNVSRRPAITVQEVENATGQAQTEDRQKEGSQKVDEATPLDKVKSTQTTQASKFPLTNSFGTRTQPTSQPSFNSDTLHQNFVHKSQPIVSGTKSPTHTGGSTSDEEVYVSNLGELSTDPEANFDPYSARIIAEPTSSSAYVKINSESGVVTQKKLNFAEKVNAGLNGVQVVNNNEVIAPEYVQNIVNKKISSPDRLIQPPAFDFASNVNSLLDEVGTEVDGRTTLQAQLRTPSDGVLESTKKPFRFLSRGFSYSIASENGPYKYGSPTASRGSLSRVQNITSIPSFTSIVQTTPLSTTSASVTSTEAAHITLLKDPPTAKYDAVSNTFGSTTNELLKKDNLVKPHREVELETAGGDEPINQTFTGASLPDLGSTKSVIPDVSESFVHDSADGDIKINVNKSAEKLLIAGVKQTILNDIGDKDNNDDFEDLEPIVPLYIRVPDQHIRIRSTYPFTTTTSAASSTSPSTSSTIAPQTLSTNSLTSTTPAIISSSTTSTTSAPDVVTTESSVEVTQPSRKYTVSSLRRRQSTRPFAYSRRQNLARSISRSTSSPSITSSTTTTHRSRGRSGLTRFTTSSTNSDLSTTRPTTSNRRRNAVNRFSIRSRTRNDTISTTTTIPVQDKKLAVRSSDKDLPDLQAVASTYSNGSKRDYNSIQQDSQKNSQAQRRRLNHTDLTTTTTTPTTSTTTETPIPSPSLSIPTLAPFTNEALSSTFITSTTSESLPTFKKNQDYSGSTLRPPTARSQQQAPVRQQTRTPTAAVPRNQELSSQRSAFQSPGKSPYVPLKQFIVNRFGANSVPGSSLPAKPSLPTLASLNELPNQLQKKPVYIAQYPMQQYHVPRTTANIKATPQPPVQYKPPQYITQRQQQQQQQPQRAYQTAPTLSPHRPIQFQRIPSISYKLPTQQQILQGFPVQRMTIQQGQQILQRTISAADSKPQQAYQQTQRSLPLPILDTFSQSQQQQRPLAPSEHIQHQVQIQASQSLPSFPSTPPSQQFVFQKAPSAQLEIFPSQEAATQSIPGQGASSASTIPEFASVNIQLPTNLAGLIPNTELYDPRLNNADSFGRAQKRYDSFGDESDSKREAKSAYSGVSSYDVPLNSVGRLANDITNLLRRVRRP